MADHPEGGYRQARYRPPRGACELILVRHGESEPLVPGRPFPLRDGHGDPALAPEGEAQAERVGAHLADAGLSAIYVTTLRRTHQTAAPLAARTGLTPVEVADLREVHLGEWEGGRYRERVAQGDPVALRVFEEQRWDVIPGGESNEALTARVVRGIDGIAARHPDQRVVAVVHGGVIGAVFARMTGSRPFAFIGADNGSISRLTVRDGTWWLRGFNDVGHLG